MKKTTQRGRTIDQTRRGDLTRKNTENRTRWVLSWSRLAAGAALTLLFAGAACADVGLGAKGSWVTNRQTDNAMGMVGGFVRVGAPMLAVEAGVDYRSEGVANNVDVKTWPMTVGLVLSPIPLVYAVAGVGWYHTTIDFPAQSAFRDETSTAFGYHAGAGLKLPVAPMVSAIADVRYSYVNYKFDEFTDALGDFKKGNFVSLNAGLMFNLPVSKRS